MSITNATITTDTNEPSDRIFAVGDIHGHLERFKNLMRMINLREEEDTLVLLGDYIDRGPDPRGTVDFILHLRSHIRKMYCLMGNHELMFLNYLKGEDVVMFINNGGIFTLDGYRSNRGRNMEIPVEHLRFLASLMSYLETESYVFVHGGIAEDIPLTRQSREDLVWARTRPEDPDVGYRGKKLIYGHYPMASPLLGKKRIGLDTGAGYGGPLTCIELPLERIYIA